MLVRCFEEVNCEKTDGQLVVAMRELAMSELPSATALIKFTRPSESVYLLSNQACRGCKFDFKYHKHVSGRNVFDGWPNVKVNALKGNVHATFYPGRPPWGLNTGVVVC